MSSTDENKSTTEGTMSGVIQIGNFNSEVEPTIVARTSDDEPLVSLDELYEGQEEINVVIDGICRLVKENRLAARPAALMGVKGTENWAPGWDVYNARIGKEGFFSAIKDGFIAIVKAIIKFIKDSGVWIYTKFMSLLGFEKTAKEQAVLVEKQTMIKNSVTSVLAGVGSKGNFDPNSFYHKLPENITHREGLVFIKNSLDSNEEAISKLSESIPELKKLLTIFGSLVNNVKTAKNIKDRAMDNLKRKFKNNTLNEGDILELSSELTVQVPDRLNMLKLRDALEDLLKVAYGISSNESDTNKKIAALTEEVKLRLEQTKSIVGTDSSNYTKAKLNSIKINEEIVNLNKNNIDLHSAIKSSKSVKAVVDSLVIQSDADFINDLVKIDPELQGLNVVYLEYSNIIKAFNKLLFESITLTQKLINSCTNIAQWHMRSTELVNMMLLSDIEEIKNYCKTKLTPEEYQAIVDGKDGIPFALQHIENAFAAKYPGVDILKTVSDYNALLFKNEDNLNSALKLVNNTLRSLGVNYTYKSDIANGV